MVIARSRVTTQGQISVPAAVRRKYGIGPGAILEWDEQQGMLVVHKAASFTFDDMHSAVFPDGAPARPSKPARDEAMMKMFRAKHARR